MCVVRNMWTAPFSLCCLSPPPVGLSAGYHVKGQVPLPFSDWIHWSRVSLCTWFDRLTQCIGAHYLYLVDDIHPGRVESSSLDAVENWPIHLDTMRYRHTTYNLWYCYKLCTRSLVKSRHLSRHCWTAYFTVVFILFLVFIAGDAMYDKCQVEPSFCLIFLAGGSLLFRLPITGFRFALNIFSRTRRRIWVNSQVK